MPYASRTLSTLPLISGDSASDLTWASQALILRSAVSRTSISGHATDSKSAGHPDLSRACTLLAGQLGNLNPMDLANPLSSFTRIMRTFTSMSLAFMSRSAY